VRTALRAARRHWRPARGIALAIIIRDVALLCRGVHMLVRVVAAVAVAVAAAVAVAVAVTLAAEVAQQLLFTRTCTVPAPTVAVPKPSSRFLWLDLYHSQRAPMSSSPSPSPSPSLSLSLSSLSSSLSSPVAPPVTCRCSLQP
jgi:hypothetical protein